MKHPTMPPWDEHDLVKKTSTLISGPHCVARFDFDGEGKDDLTFEEDDVIKLVGRVGSEWLKGELNGKMGIFPISFVEIVEDLPADVVEKSSDGLGTAMFDFDGRDDELSFQAGQKLMVLSHINIEWLYGEVDGRKGKFPSAFIDFIPSNLPQYEPANQDAYKLSTAHPSTNQTPDFVDAHINEPIPEPQTLSTNQSQAFCVANHDFEGHHDEDLSFKTGEVIQLLEKIGDDWMKGSCNGKTGMFPAGFVIIKKDLPEISDSQLGATAAPVSPHLAHAKALYDFVGQNDKELSFKAGDIIELGNIVSSSPDWQYGNIDGRSGMFPTSFVEIIS